MPDNCFSTDRGSYSGRQCLLQGSAQRRCHDPLLHSNCVISQLANCQIPEDPQEGPGWRSITKSLQPCRHLPKSLACSNTDHRRTCMHSWAQDSASQVCLRIGSFTEKPLVILGYVGKSWPGMGMGASSPCEYTKHSFHKTNRTVLISMSSRVAYVYIQTSELLAGFPPFPGLGDLNISFCLVKTASLHLLQRI